MPKVDVVLEQSQQVIVYEEFVSDETDSVAISMELDSLKMFGELTLAFNESLNTDFDLSNMTSILNITVLPDQERQFMDDFDPNMLNMNWEALDFENDLLVIQLMFDQPDEISSFNFEDHLLIEIKDRQ